MKNKTNKRQRITRSKVRALVPLNTDKIRRNELNKLKCNKATCASLKEQAEQFEKKDYPAFTKWIHVECGEIIEKTNTLRGKMSALQNTLYLAEDLYCNFPSCTVKACADAAAHYIDTNGEIPAGFESFFKEDPPNEFEDDNPSDPFEDEEEADAARKFFDSLFEDLDKESDFDGPDPFAPTKQQKKRWAEEDKCIKKLYRKIIRKLHPDRAGSSTPQQQELWHAAKKAYDARDLETLQHIEENCDLLNDRLTRFASISSIRNGIHFYKQANKKIRRTLRQMKKQLEWGFSSWSEKKKKGVLKKRLNVLNADHSMLIVHCSSLKDELDRIRKTPRTKIKKTGRSHANQEQFDFF